MAAAEALRKSHDAQPHNARYRTHNQSPCPKRRRKASVETAGLEGQECPKNYIHERLLRRELDPKKPDSRHPRWATEARAFPIGNSNSDETGDELPTNNSDGMYTYVVGILSPRS